MLVKYLAISHSDSCNKYYIYILQGARDYLFQLSQWEQLSPNPYYLFIIYLLVLFDYFIIVVIIIIDVVIYLFN